MNVTALDLETFRKSRELDHDKYMTEMGYDWRDPVTIKVGKKYAKLCIDHSVRVFIDLNNGDIYMAASWAKPAKHVRGNIYSQTNGSEAFGRSGHALYLK